MTPATGRPKSIDPGQLSRTALNLFTELGFASVTMDDIAQANGVSRRSAFRLFPTKASLVWGGFDQYLDRARSALSELELELTGVEVAGEALVAAARFAAADIEVTRQRFEVIAKNPELAGEGAEHQRALARLLSDAIAVHDRTDASDLATVVLAASRVAEAHAALAWWAQHSTDPPHVVVARAMSARTPHGA